MKLHWSVQQLDQLLALLRDDDYQVIGPAVRDNALVYEVYDTLSALPVGVGDEQEAGRYRLRDRGDQTRFGYNLGPSSWKQFLFPPVEKLFEYRNGIIASTRPSSVKQAFIGVRACELAAIHIQDRVFLQGEFSDSGYAARREQTLIVAVSCSQAAPTCFCTANEDGPAIGDGADIVLVEVGTTSPWYLVEACSEQGEAFVGRIGGALATDLEINEAAQQIEQAAHQITRQLPRQQLKESLYASLEHPHWEEVANRCLACGNCTQVCPSCFCSRTSDQTDVVSGVTSHERHWDSCFTEMHSYASGAPVHSETRSRYRQWLVHKLAAWEDQFGQSGCTGCGRCITWCPVGIDLTEEVKTLRATT